jgi:hypothetical protein
VARALGQADASIGPGGGAALFDILPRGWPAAAVTRQVDRGDAAGAQWVRADPAYVRPDINGARLLAIGEALGLDDASAEAFLAPLRPVFGDFGLPIEATTPSRWHLRVEPGAPLPRFADPDQALGADLFDHLPAGDVGRRWRALLSDAQVTLHQHPLNAERAARGLAPINSVWFWGAGTLPDHVRTAYPRIASDDEVVAAFAALAGVRHAPLPSRWPGAGEGDVAFDVRGIRRLDAACADWIGPALADVRRGALASLRLAFDDGAHFAVRRSQSMRFWRRPLRTLVERDAQ